MSQVNSGAKGKRAERELAKLLSARFGKTFSRSVGSGNRWGQVANLPSHAVETFSGDLTPPEGFRWVIECKCGYEDVNLGSLAPSRTLDAFIDQVSDDATRSGRKPLLGFKQARRPWVAGVRRDDLPDGWDDAVEHYRAYGGWIFLPLTDLLGFDGDGFWFTD